VEVWRFYESAQLVYLIAVSEDWAEEAPPAWRPPEHVLAARPVLGAGDAVFRIAETYEYAARLVSLVSGTDPINIRIELHGMRGRRLWLEDRGRQFFQDYVAHDEVPPFSKTYPRADLLAEASALALEPMRYFFARFGWDASEAVLRSLQKV
jgi:hypothetical protein